MIRQWTESQKRSLCS